MVRKAGDSDPPGTFSKSLRLTETSCIVIADEWTFILKIGCRWLRFMTWVPELWIVNIFVVVVLCSCLVLILNHCWIYCTCGWICHNIYPVYDKFTQ